MFDFGNLGMQDMNGIGVRFCSAHSTHSPAQPSASPSLPHPSLLFLCSKLWLLLLPCTSGQRPTENDLVCSQCIVLAAAAAAAGFWGPGVALSNARLPPVFTFALAFPTAQCLADLESLESCR